MVKNIFIPERIGSYYLFTHRAAGLSINTNMPTAVRVVRQGNNCTIESAQSFANQEDLEGFIEKIKKNNKIRLSLSNEDVIFKELTLPFLDKAKIRMILPFELEASLPFSISLANIDFVITHQNKENKTSTVMAVVTKEDEISKLLQNLGSLKLAMPTVTVSGISIYCLYKAINKSGEASILLEMSNRSISMSYIDNQKRLRLVRTIPKGIERDSINSADGVRWLTDEISFSINSFKSQLLEFDEPAKIVIIWNMQEVEALYQLIESNTGLKTEAFPVAKIREVKGIKDKASLTQENLAAFATAYTTNDNLEFNLFQKKETAKPRQFLYKIIPSTAIIILLFISLILLSRSKIKSLEHQIIQSKQQVVGRLQRTFDIKDKKVLRSLNALTKEANRIVTEEENLWFSFSKSVRFSYLRHLEELSKLLDKKELGLTVNKLSIGDGIITLQGEVPSYPQLEALDKSLESSKLFSHITRPEDLKFTIKITLKKNNEDLE